MKRKHAQNTATNGRLNAGVIVAIVAGFVAMFCAGVVVAVVAGVAWLNENHTPRKRFGSPIPARRCGLFN